MASHEESRISAEQARQQAHKAATTDAQHKAADIAYYQAMVLAGRQFHVKNGAASALASLGVNPVAGSFTSDDS